MQVCIPSVFTTLNYLLTLQGIASRLEITIKEVTNSNTIIPYMGIIKWGVVQHIYIYI